MQNEQTADEIRREKRHDVASQYDELKKLRKQLAIEQSKLLRQTPVGTKH